MYIFGKHKYKNSSSKKRKKRKRKGVYAWLESIISRTRYDLNHLKNVNIHENMYKWQY